MKRAIINNVPGDGSCLFHSIAYPLKSPKFTGVQLRDITSKVIEKHSDSLLHGISLKNWIEWESGDTVQQYVRKLKNGMWGGALEMTILASLLNIHFYVYAPILNLQTNTKQCKRVLEVKPDKDFLKNSVKRPNVILNDSICNNSQTNNSQPNNSNSILSNINVSNQNKICLLWVNKCHYMHLQLL
jgi:hypothetical protein